MLNEKAEYELYLTKGYGGLMRRENLHRELSGVRAAMTILARGFLERCAQSGITDIERRYRYTLAFLKAWTAGEDVPKADAAALQEMADIPALAYDLQRATQCNLTSHLIDEKAPITLAKTTYSTPSTIADAMRNKVAAWDRSMFSSSRKDSQNQMYYKALIADALHKGPLTSKLLVLRDDCKHGLEGSGVDEHLPYALGIVATYLQAKPVGQKSAPVVMSHISNYLDVWASSKGADKRLCLTALMTADAFSYNGQPLFEKIEVTGGSRKLIVNPTWLDDMDVHLEDADASAIAYAYVRYSDSSLFPHRFPMQTTYAEITR